MASKLPCLLVAACDFSFANNDIYLPVSLISILYKGSFLIDVNSNLWFYNDKEIGRKKSCRSWNADVKLPKILQIDTEYYKNVSAKFWIFRSLTM